MFRDVGDEVLGSYAGSSPELEAHERHDPAEVTLTRQLVARTAAAFSHGDLTPEEAGEHLGRAVPCEQVEEFVARLVERERESEIETDLKAREDAQAL